MNMAVLIQSKHGVSQKIGNKKPSKNIDAVASLLFDKTLCTHAVCANIISSLRFESTLLIKHC